MSFQGGKRNNQGQQNEYYMGHRTVLVIGSEKKLSKKKVLTSLLLRKTSTVHLLCILIFLMIKVIEKYFIISDTLLPNLFRSTFARAHALFGYVASFQDGVPKSHFHQQFMRMPVSYKIATTRCNQSFPI